ncbi:hypothetical protein STAS_25735 [Striga asiatica]|uniref:Uncharacterized protein n=1 Tax=Striga asiatica TaxID=4170 RepID=A0A5A7QT75_STRAF|nr:hypothetical protein STAS_25735 [Striga asiatica]
MRGWCCPVGAALLLRCCGSVTERLRCCGSAVLPCFSFAIIDHRGAAAGFGRGAAQREGVGCGSGGLRLLVGVARADTSARLPLLVLCAGSLVCLPIGFELLVGTLKERNCIMAYGSRNVYKHNDEGVMKILSKMDPGNYFVQVYVDSVSINEKGVCHENESRGDDKQKGIAVEADMQHKCDDNGYEDSIDDEYIPEEESSESDGLDGLIIS